MDKHLRDKIHKYANLFGLIENFTLEELNRSYRTLAKLNHPDINRDEASDDRMIIINEGFNILKDALERGILQDFIEEGFDSKKEDDIFYRQYKKGFKILQSAFDDYFGEGDRKRLEGKLDRLKERLLIAKMEFSRLLTDMPYSQWVDDAIDKISSINKWIE